MGVEEALARLKYLVSHNQFHIVNRRSRAAMPVSRTLAKVIVQQLSVQDFKRHEPNLNCPEQFVWIFITDDEQRYYIKFVFIHQNTEVVFISFHLSRY